MNTITEFNRHELFNPMDMELIKLTISAFWDNDWDNDEEILNKLNGLYDGFLYHDLPQLAKSLMDYNKDRIHADNVYVLARHCARIEMIYKNIDSRINNLKN